MTVYGPYKPPLVPLDRQIQQLIQESLDAVQPPPGMTERDWAFVEDRLVPSRPRDGAGPHEPADGATPTIEECQAGCLAALRLENKALRSAVESLTKERDRWLVRMLELERRVAAARQVLDGR